MIFRETLRVALSKSGGKGISTSDKAKDVFSWAVAFAKATLGRGLWKSSCAKSRRPFGEADVTFEKHLKRTHMSFAIHPI
jgi:hypothetical protein